MLLLSVIGFILPLVCELTLCAHGRRVRLARGALTRGASTTNAPEYFGISDMIPDRHPINEKDSEKMDLDAWAGVRTAILDRLGEVEEGLAENFCWVTHETILDGEGYVAEGGLVAVVQKRTVVRINFYRMQDFRTWVSIKKLDIGSNERFADEEDVWVVRLTDESQASKEPLPNLDGEVPQPIEVSPERLERAIFMRSDDFARAFPIPQAGQEQLIPSLVPEEGEAFLFELNTSSSTLHKKWRWTFGRANVGAGIEEIVFDDKTILEARRPRWPRRREWIVSDASYSDLSIPHRLFTVQSTRDGTLHNVMTLPSSESPAEKLFVIRVEVSPGSRRVWTDRQVTIKIFNKDEDTVLFTGETAETPPGMNFFMFFSSGSDTEDDDRIVGAFAITEDDRMLLQVTELADAALLLVATAVIPDSV
eukprot:TRINITY_DN10582_c0_g1_i1.p1 TRINITY_DN10582_c0_g1~~TRINITY_DN10582_c0_g1_i1.p1  ORF type:complete len:422 (-),score=45.48 TRINITY_DN10582_c0_g1_i1:110-1375(-)